MPIHAQGVPLSTSRLLGSLKSANMNSTADQPIIINCANYIIDKIIVTNPSTSLTLAAGGVYTAPAKSGTVVVAAAQLYSALTAAAKWLALTLAAIVGTDRRTEQTLYFALTTAQGGAATADIYIFGTIIP